MPTVQMTVPQGDLTREQSGELVERVTTVVSDFFREYKQEEVRDFVVVHIRETAEGGYALGGQVIG